MRRPKKSQLMPIVIGAAALAAYFLFMKPASAAPAPEPAPPPPPMPPAPAATDYPMQTSGGAMTTAQAQKMLKSLGKPAGDSAMASLVIDGVYGPNTAKAIVHFQVIKGIAQTGVVDPPTAPVLVADYNDFIASGGTPAT